MLTPTRMKYFFFFFSFSSSLFFFFSIAGCLFQYICIGLLESLQDIGRVNTPGSISNQLECIRILYSCRKLPRQSRRFEKGRKVINKFGKLHDAEERQAGERAIEMSNYCSISKYFKYGLKSNTVYRG